jgi:hypothetical protein
VIAIRARGGEVRRVREPEVAVALGAHRPPANARHVVADVEVRGGGLVEVEAVAAAVELELSVDELGPRERVARARRELVPRGVIGLIVGGDLPEEQAVVDRVARGDLELVVVRRVAVPGVDHVRPAVGLVGDVAGDGRAAVLIESRVELGAEVADRGLEGVDGPGRSLGSLGALGTLRALCTLGALCTLRALDALRTGGALGALGSGGARRPGGAGRPVAPVAPVAPVLPVSPLSPLGPAAPARLPGPGRPARLGGRAGRRCPGVRGPAGPVAPSAPSAPAGPCGPAGPAAPTAPEGPCGPAGPWGPVGPSSPEVGPTHWPAPLTTGFPLTTRPPATSRTPAASRLICSAP